MERNLVLLVLKLYFDRDGIVTVNQNPSSRLCCTGKHRNGHTYSRNRVKRQFERQIAVPFICVCSGH